MSKDQFPGTPIPYIQEKSSSQPCQHTNAILTIIEGTYHKYHFRNGEITDVDDDFEPDLTNELNFSCPDCRMKDEWSDYRDAPVAVKALYQKILEKDYSASSLPER